MQIEEGKYYKTRDGRKVGPIIVNDTEDPVWYVESGELAGTWYDDDGKYSFTEEDRPEDLVAEWSTGPVVTELVQKTRIVPGTYGIVTVGSLLDDTHVWVDMDGYRTADELDAAAAVLSALAKGLRDVD